MKYCVHSTYDIFLLSIFLLKQTYQQTSKMSSSHLDFEIPKDQKNSQQSVNTGKRKAY